MKKILLLFCILLFACNNENSNSEKVDETISISNSDQLEHLLTTAIPIEGGYSIDKQPENFSISEIRYTNKGIVYFYKPKKGFTGEVFVTIKREDSNGAEIISETFTTLKIKVTD